MYQNKDELSSALTAFVGSRLCLRKSDMIIAAHSAFIMHGGKRRFNNIVIMVDRTSFRRISSLKDVEVKASGNLRYRNVTVMLTPQKVDIDVIDGFKVQTKKSLLNLLYSLKRSTEDSSHKRALSTIIALTIGLDSAQLSLAF